MTREICLAHAGLVEQIKTVCIKLEAHEKLDLERLAAIDKAMNTAKIEMERRLESMNEFRAQLSKQAASFVNRETIDIKLEKMQEDIDDVKQCTSVSSGSDKWRDHLVTVGISLGVFLLAHFLFKF